MVFFNPNSVTGIPLCVAQSKHTRLGIMLYSGCFITTGHSIYHPLPVRRERVSFSSGITVLAYTGARPGAIVESGTKGIRRLWPSNAVSWSQAQASTDLLMAILCFVLEVTIRLNEGKRKTANFQNLSHIAKTRQWSCRVSNPSFPSPSLRLRG